MQNHPTMEKDKHSMTTGGPSTETQNPMQERSSPEDSKIADDEDRYRFIGVIDDTDNTSNEMLGEKRLGRQDIQTLRE